MLAFAVGQPNLGVHKSLVSQIWAFISRAARKMMARAADNGCKRLTPSRRTARRSKRWCSQGNSPTRTSLGSRGMCEYPQYAQATVVCADVRTETLAHPHYIQLARPWTYYVPTDPHQQTVLVLIS